MPISRREAVIAGLVSGVALKCGVAEADTPIKLGSLLDLSGPLASTGIPMFDALTVAISAQNKSGGLLGRPIELINYNTQSSIQLYSQYAQKLALQDRVDVVLGGITSASREAIRPVFNRYKTLYFYNTFYEGGVCDLDVYCTGTTPSQTVRRLVEYAITNWGKKVYIIAADYNYGQITASWMSKYSRENGGRAVATEFFPLDVTDFQSAISKIQEEKPDLIFSALVGSNHIAFYRQWGAAGMTGKIPIASTTFGIANELAILPASQSNGIVTAYGYYQDLKTPENLEFVGAIHKRFGANVPYISEPACCTYEAFFLWVNGVLKAGTTKRLPVIKALDTGVGFQGPSGHVTIDPQTHSVIRDVYLARVVNKSWDVFATYKHQKPLNTEAVCNLIAHPKVDKQFILNPQN